VHIARKTRSSFWSAVLFIIFMQHVFDNGWPIQSHAPFAELNYLTYDRIEGIVDVNDFMFIKISGLMIFQIKSSHNVGAVNHRIWWLCCLPLDYMIIFPLSQNVDVMIVVFVFFFVFVTENHFFLALLHRRFEDLIWPLIFTPPIILFGFVLKIVIADVWVTVWDANVNSFVFKYSGNFP